MFISSSSFLAKISQREVLIFHNRTSFLRQIQLHVSIFQPLGKLLRRPPFLPAGFHH